MRFLIFLLVFILILVIPNSYSQDCTIQDHCGDGICGSSVEIENCNTCPQDCGSCCVCSAGQVQYDGNCGNCGTLRRDCDGCNWGSWYCTGETPNYGQSCGNCGTISCGGSCVNQGVCSPSSTQCSGATYQTCTSGCQWQNSGTDADNDGTYLQCGDSLCDNAPGVYDSTKTATETNCNDGLDNDCNGLIDCADPACGGSISGTVMDNNNQPVSGADVSVNSGLTTIKSATTSQQGSYSLAGVNCGSYSLSVVHPDYAPKTDTISLAPNQQATKDYTLVLGTSCEADCTYANDNIIHASCDGKNGCTFYDPISKAACDNSQPGWARDYDANNYVTCASGTPQPTVTIQASVSCESGTLVKVTRIVVYNGEPVKLVVAACG